MPSGALLDVLVAPPEGHDEAILAACGATPLEALSGPMPPGFGVMAIIAAPMLGMADTPVCEVAKAMAADASEWAWRAALLPFFQVGDA